MKNTKSIHYFEHKGKEIAILLKPDGDSFLRVGMEWVYITSFTYPNTTATRAKAAYKKYLSNN